MGNAEEILAAYAKSKGTTPPKIINDPVDTTKKAETVDPPTVTDPSKTTENAVVEAEDAREQMNERELGIKEAALALYEAISDVDLDKIKSKDNPEYIHIKNLERALREEIGEGRQLVIDDEDFLALLQKTSAKFEIALEEELDGVEKFYWDKNQGIVRIESRFDAYGLRQPGKRYEGLEGLATEKKTEAKPQPSSTIVGEVAQPVEAEHETTSNLEQYFQGLDRYFATELDGEHARLAGFESVLGNAKARIDTINKIISQSLDENFEKRLENDLYDEKNRQYEHARQIADMDRREAEIKIAEAKVNIREIQEYKDRVDRYISELRLVAEERGMTLSEIGLDEIYKTHIDADFIRNAIESIKQASSERAQELLIEQGLFEEKWTDKAQKFFKGSRDRLSKWLKNPAVRTALAVVLLGAVTAGGLVVNSAIHNSTANDQDQTRPVVSSSESSTEIGGADQPVAPPVGSASEATQRVVFPNNEIPSFEPSRSAEAVSTTSTPSEVLRQLDETIDTTERVYELTGTEHEYTGEQMDRILEQWGKEGFAPRGGIEAFQDQTKGNLRYIVEGQNLIIQSDKYAIGNRYTGTEFKTINTPLGLTDPSEILGQTPSNMDRFTGDEPSDSGVQDRFSPDTNTQNQSNSDRFTSGDLDSPEPQPDNDTKR
jgi:hypothetical protein